MCLEVGNGLLFSADYDGNLRSWMLDSLEVVGSVVSARMHTHMHTNTHKHRHAHTHAHKHTNMHTNTHKHTRTCTHMHMNTHTHTHMHTNTRRHTHVRARTHTHTHTTVLSCPPTLPRQKAHKDIVSALATAGRFLFSGCLGIVKVGREDYITHICIAFHLLSCHFLCPPLLLLSGLGSCDTNRSPLLP